jgi:sortase B
VLVFALSAVLVFSAFSLLKRLLEYRAAAGEYASYASMMNEPQPSDTPAPVLALQAPAAEDSTEPADRTPIPKITAIPYYSDQILRLKSQNSDTVGYLQIEGTAIQYPVVKGKDNEYYTTHTFSKKRNASGSIFMDCKNSSDLSDFNTVLYGHNMKDGSMFHELLQYRKTSFLQEHRKIVLTGLFEKKTYYVFSVYTTGQDTDMRGFSEHTAYERQEYLKTLIARSDISAGAATPTVDDKYITLVTCRENSDGDYFVVHGILVE